MALISSLVVQKSIIACGAATLSLSGLLLVATEQAPLGPSESGVTSAPPAASWHLAECPDVELELDQQHL